MKKLLLSLSIFLHPGHAAATPVYTLTGEVDSDMADKVTQFLDENPGPVTIQINSPGGSVISAGTIEDTIESHGQVTCRSS